MVIPHASWDAPSTLARMRLHSPVGELLAFAGDEGLCALSFEDGRYDPLAHLRARFGEVRVMDADRFGVKARLAAYFEGDLAALEGIPVDTGGTPFQRLVWTALRTIPAGRTASYLDV